MWWQGWGGRMMVRRLCFWCCFIAVAVWILVSWTTSTTTTTTVEGYITGTGTTGSIGLPPPPPPPLILPRPLQRLDLQPTASLIEERYHHQRRRRRYLQQKRRSNSSRIHDDDEEEEDLLLVAPSPERWFHPQVRAVYATLHPPSSFVTSHKNKYNNATTTASASAATLAAIAAAHYDEFCRFRHLSRYERQSRLELLFMQQEQEQQQQQQQQHVVRQLQLHPYWSGNYSEFTWLRRTSQQSNKNDNRSNTSNTNTNNGNHTTMDAKKSTSASSSRRRPYPPARRKLVAALWPTKKERKDDPHHHHRHHHHHHHHHHPQSLNHRDNGHHDRHQQEHHEDDGEDEDRKRSEQSRSQSQSHQKKQDQYSQTSPTTTTTTTTRRHASSSSSSSAILPLPLTTTPPPQPPQPPLMVTGGQFNHYQGIPLSQGYGTHYVHLWVGSPIPQRQSVIVDTGSHFTAFPCTGCQDCGQDHHTDPYFDPSQSQTFRPLTCPTECQEHATCTTTTTTTTTTANSAASSGGKDSIGKGKDKDNKVDKNHNGNRNTGITQSETPAGGNTRGRNHQSNNDDNDNDNQKDASYCHFTQSYTEGSSWTAYQARDFVYAGGPDILEAANPLDRQYSLPFMFGCLQQSTGLFITQLADGIMGLSAHETTLPKQLYNQGKLEYNMFAMCFRKELGTSRRGVTAGSLTLGGVSSTLDTSPMVFARNTQPYGWFTVHVEHIYIAKHGGSQFLLDDSASQELLDSIISVPMNAKTVNESKGVIVDSGTTDTYLNSKVLPAFVQVWKQVTGGMEYTHAPVYLTKSQLLRLPTILIQCQAAQVPTAGAGAGTTTATTTTTTGSDTTTHPVVVGQVGRLDPERPQDVLLAIPADHYMEYSPTLKLYTSRLYFTESRGGVLGANAMQGHNVLFDWQHGRIGFSQSSCEYDLLELQQQTANQQLQQQQAHDKKDYARETYPSGQCVLGSPILTTACIESVDVSICEASDHPGNVQVMGTEVWTRVVETPGSDPASCQHVATTELWSTARTSPENGDVDNTSGDGSSGSRGDYSETTQRHRRHRHPQNNADWDDEDEDDDELVVECTLNGLCTEYRTCQVPCLEAMEYSRKSSQAASKLTAGERVHQDPAKNGEKEDALCGDTFWSACDFDCKQTRLVSVPTATNGVCKETSRSSRECHVDACGRLDPCLVPFLVHAILVLETTPNKQEEEEWTLRSLERFQKEFTRVSHLPEFSSVAARRPLFHEGDVDVLVVRPWDEEDQGEEQEGPNDTTSDEGGPKGIQLILQVSIFNPKVHKISPRSNKGRRRLVEPGENHGRHLLQEVGVLWQNLTQPFRVPKQTFTCNPSDLYPLAKDAVEMANGILEHPQFGARLVEHMPSYTTARVVSSWTIGTQVYDSDVNYYGPIAMTPYLLIFRILYETSLVFFLLSLVSCIVQCCYNYRHWFGALRRRLCGKPARYYAALDTEDHDDDNEQGLTPTSNRIHRPQDGPMELELSCVRTFSDSHKKNGTTATKRHNSMTHSKSQGDAP